jgi:hypothetical protein
MTASFAAVRVGDSVQQGLDSFFAFIPRLLGFLIVLAIGWIVARIVRTVVTKALAKVGLDRALHSGTTGRYVDRVSARWPSPSRSWGSRRWTTSSPPSARTCRTSSPRS